jgi:hypothetical protein
MKYPLPIWNEITEWRIETKSDWDSLGVKMWIISVVFDTNMRYSYRYGEQNVYRKDGLFNGRLNRERLSKAIERLKSDFTKVSKDKRQLNWESTKIN